MARAATKDSDRDGKDRHASVSARRQYTKLIAQAHRAAPDARLALYSLSNDRLRDSRSAGQLNFPHANTAASTR